MPTTLDHIYDFVERIIQEASKHGRMDIAGRLDEALQLGSSPLEILGAISIELRKEGTTIDSWFDRQERERVLCFIDRAYGRIPRP